MSLAPPPVREIILNIHGADITALVLARPLKKRGASRNGWYEEAQNLIMLARSLAPPQRLHALMHECYHVQNSEDDDDADPEGNADAFAEFATAVYREVPERDDAVYAHIAAKLMPSRPVDQLNSFADLAADLGRQLDAQGGEATLMALKPRMVTYAGPDAPEGIASDRRECGDCKAAVMIGSVAKGRPIFEPELDCWWCAAGILCDCNSGTVWSEKCTASGQLLGDITTHIEPEVLRGAELVSWCLKNGVEMRPGHG